MGERPGRSESSGSGAEEAIATSAMGNSTAFGYSIMITVTFGMVSRVQGTPTIAELFGFAAAASVAVAVIEGLITRGFRRRLKRAPNEVVMLGTAMNVFSVTASVAGALAMATALNGFFGWPVAALVASGLYVLLEGVEILLAERIQAARGDPAATKG